jgi:hypothetical protein
VTVVPTERLTDGDSYTREELQAVGAQPPQRGPFCPHCSQRIPQFADLSEADERRVRSLIGHFRTEAAVLELMGFTGCPESWARLWVEHRGRPIPTPGETPPCPYCGKPLRTSLAKQCRFCLRDWHDPDHVGVLGQAR